jgi:cell volume regulation protein A
MDSANQILLFGSALVVVSVLAGRLSNRTGAPLLLVFLALGMLAGEDGPGGVVFDDFNATYIVGSTALAIILFDGGLRTPRASFRVALWPSLWLATVGVIVTAGLTGAVAMWLLGLTWLPALLLGSIVASTDAAAVFFLLRQHNMRLRERVGATLEVESGINDPMAIFLTLLCVELLQAGVGSGTELPFWHIVGSFAQQFLGGLAVGTAGGFALLALINRIVVAPGLYPILAVAAALFLFSGAQALGTSGYLAVFLAGLVVGNHRHRATLSISRFHDGLAWLGQIVMFVMLGLLVTPSQLLPSLPGYLILAVFLILIGRPIAVYLCLLPFRFQWQERLYIAWIGLRGAVPIFLGTIPVLAGIESGPAFFGFAFVVVLSSLVVQGWTVAPVARWLDLQLPPLSPKPRRVDIALPAEAAGAMVAYTVHPNAAVVDRGVKSLPLPPGVKIASIVRDGVTRTPDEVGQLAPDDTVLVMAAGGNLDALDSMFAEPAARRTSKDEEELFGQFTFSGDLPLFALGDLYGLPVPEDSRAQPVGDFLQERFESKATVGDRLRLGGADVIVIEMADECIVRVGIELEPESWWHRHIRPLRAWLAARFRRRPPAAPAKASDAPAGRSAPAAPNSPASSGS